MILWIDSHLFKRILPDVRDRLGDKSKLFVALGSVAGLILMVIGYRMADGPVYWNRSPMLAGINNLLMLIAIFLFIAGNMPSPVRRKIRHPQLAGTKTWAIAHLLVNGDLASIILFGGLLAWAVVSVILINRAEPHWVAPEPAGRKTYIRLAVITLVMLLVITGIHALLGVNPFG